MQFFVLWFFLFFLHFNEQIFALKTVAINKIDQNKKYQYELAIAAIFKDEGYYLKEWIEFHKLVGVQHFYLYNNLSTDDYKSILQPYIEKGEVDLIDWPFTFTTKDEWNTIQLNAYDDAIKITLNKVKWVAFIDLDEFLFPVRLDNLQDFLKGYEQYAGVCVNWQCYGTSHVKQIPPYELIIDKLLWKSQTDLDKNGTVKSIVRPECVVKCISPHRFTYKFGYCAVNSNRQKIRRPKQPVLIDQVRINHYWTRDESYFINKKMRRQKERGRPEERTLLRANQYNVVYDPCILRFVPKLKENIGLE